jgi:hypothetical protein
MRAAFCIRATLMEAVRTLKRQSTSKRLHGAVSQNAAIFMPGYSCFKIGFNGRPLWRRWSTLKFHNSICRSSSQRALQIEDLASRIWLLLSSYSVLITRNVKRTYSGYKFSTALPGCSAVKGVSPQHLPHYCCIEGLFPPLSPSLTRKLPRTVQLSELEI